MADYDLAKLSALCSACTSAVGNHAKGEAMADLVEYLFAAVPGVTLIERSHTYPDDTAEVDFIFGNRYYISRLPTTGVTLFVECKNEARKISAAQVRVFGTKLRDRNQRFGIMATRKGLSGKNLSYAHGAIAREMQDSRSIVVITLADLQNLTDSDSLVVLCERRLEDLEANGTYRTI
jgi:hypothetical protein